MPIALSCQAVLAADHGLHDVVLPDVTFGSQTDDSEQIGGDHDRLRTSRADGLPIERRLQSGTGCQGLPSI